MKLNYIVTQQYERGPKTLHLCDAKMKKVCRCDTRGLIREKFELQERPTGAIPCTESAQHLRDIRERFKFQSERQQA